MKSAFCDFSMKTRLNRWIQFLLLFLIMFQTAFASAPMSKVQVPGYFRMMLGEFEVTALYDGPAVFGPDVFTNTHPKEIQDLLKSAYLPEDSVSVSVSAYLINTGAQLILVDTGAGGFWPGLGALKNDMKAAGYTPDQVDMVLMTHLHVDHDGGLLTSDGNPVFPNADILVAKAENDFWTSKDNADKAPDALKGMFNIARTASSVYQGRWKPFYGEAELTPGIKPVSLPGHTVGHTGYLITSKGKSLLIWGDIVHSAAIQIPEPAVGFAYDMDTPMAINTRQHILRRVVEERLMVAGAHLPFPGIGHIQDFRGMYHWVPVEYAPIP